MSMSDNEREKPLDKQVGGDHYLKYRMQPVDAIRKTNLDFVRGNILKYLVRYKDKNGVEDLKKARHYAEILREQVMMRFDVGETFIEQFQDTDSDVRRVMRLLLDHFGQLENIRELLEQLDRLIKKEEQDDAL